VIDFWLLFIVTFFFFPTETCVSKWKMVTSNQIVIDTIRYWAYCSH